MKDEKSPPSAAERAAATVAAAAAAAAAEEEEESVAGDDNERHALLGTAAAAAAAEEREGAAPIESSGEPAAAAAGEPAAAAAGEPAAAAEAAAAAAARRPRTSLRPSSPPTAIRLLRKPERQALEDSIEAAKHKYFSFKTPSRSCEWLRCLPVLFLMLLVLYINTVYVLLHCLPQLQRALPPPLRDSRRFKRGTYELIAFAAISFLFLMSYWLAVTTPAGSIPDTPEWSLEEEEEKETSKTTHAAAIETKKGGGRRACKWCMKLKPDRSHHCRVCRKCILKMDHHCPWLFNCVGFNNHKFFFLALLWGDTLAIFVAATMLPSVQNAIKNEQVSFEKVFMLLFAETLDICLCVLMSGFLLFHSYLITNAVTTIEFCEKKYKKFSFDGQSEVSWSRGFAKNFIDAFGPDPLFWFFPVDNRLGDGLSFSPGFSFYFEGAEKERRIAKAARRYRGFDPIVDPDS